MEVMLTRGGACMRKAVLVVKVSREEISVRLQYCTYWWESCQIKSIWMFSYTLSYMEFMSVE